MEIEVKFWVRDLAAVRRRLEAAGGRLLRPRTLERNLRFDTPDGALTRAHRVLRLRMDTVARLTYKGPGFVHRGVRHRDEIEFEVSDFGAARALLESLGYRVSAVYEKYRTEAVLEDTHIALDETPIGQFVEIEGPDAENIRRAAERLGLRWEAGIQAGYLSLFDRLRDLYGWGERSFTFAALGTVQVEPHRLGLAWADETGETDEP